MFTVKPIAGPYILDEKFPGAAHLLYNLCLPWIGDLFFVVVVFCFLSSSLRALVAKIITSFFSISLSLSWDTSERKKKAGNIVLHTFFLYFFKFLAKLIQFYSFSSSSFETWMLTYLFCITRTEHITGTRLSFNLLWTPVENEMRKNLDLKWKIFIENVCVACDSAVIWEDWWADIKTTLWGVGRYVIWWGGLLISHYP